MNYPSQLEADLQQRFPGAAIRVINRGKSGEDAQEELARLDHDVVAEHPDLAIWQLGTNAVLRHDDPGADGERIERGIGLMRQNGTDVVLMDLQYAPRVLARPAYPQMEQAIADAAGHAHAGLFRRFDIMREWATVQPNDSQPMVGADGLHMTDRGYACISAALAEALGWNWWSQERARHHGPGATVAGLASPVEAGSPVPPAQ
jgi:lysophospholipase L1-like esterase